jgi:hypothetical protein
VEGSTEARVEREPAAGHHDRSLCRNRGRQGSGYDVLGEFSTRLRQADRLQSQEQALVN